jgi:hypothetical protein
VAFVPTHSGGSATVSNRLPYTQAFAFLNHCITEEDSFVNCYFLFWSFPKNSGIKQYKVGWVPFGFTLLTHRGFANPSKDGLDAVGQCVVVKIRDAEDTSCCLERMTGGCHQAGLPPGLCVAG